MNLRRKILVGSSGALLLTALVVAWAVVNLVRLGRASDAILEENYRSILAAENMVGAIEREDSAALLLVLGFGDEAAAQQRAADAQFLQWLGRAKDNITIPGEGQVVAGIEDAYDRYREAFAALVGRSSAGQATLARDYHEQVLPLFQRVRSGCQHLREINQTTMFAASATARTVATHAIWSMAVTGLVAVVLGLGFSFVLSERILRPLRELMTATARIGAGDYGVEVDASSPDELGALGRAFNSMARQLASFQRLNIEHILTEQRTGEAIIQSIDDGIVVLDRELRVTGLNRRAAEAFDIDPGYARGRDFIEVFARPALGALLRQVAETGRRPEIPENERLLSVPGKEGVAHFLVSITPVNLEGQSTAATVLVLHDVTRMRELDRLRSEFVMTASHQLRTPLTSIGMSVDLLRESAMDKLSSEERTLLGAAHEEVERLKALVSDLLDLSKIEAGQLTMELAPITVRTLFDKVVSVFLPQTSAAGVRLEAEAPDTFPLVTADATKIAWVLANLVSNALRYVSPGGHIRLTAGAVGRHAHVSVSDDGAGIPPSYQARIFDKFVQVGGDRDSGGTGLGLAICREIVRAHRGTIWVESAPGKGSTFTFTLPLAGGPEEVL